GRFVGTGCSRISGGVVFGCLFFLSVLLFFIQGRGLSIILSGRRRRSDLQIHWRAEASVQVTINLTSHCCGEMFSAIDTSSDDHHSQSRTHEWRVRRKQTEPGPFPNASAGLTRNSLHWIVRLLA